jgi:hypothetical protein
VDDVVDLPEGLEDDESMASAESVGETKADNPNASDRSSVDGHNGSSRARYPDLYPGRGGHGAVG